DGGRAAAGEPVRWARKLPCLPRLRRARDGATSLRESLRRPDGPLCCRRYSLIHAPPNTSAHYAWLAVDQHAAGSGNVMLIEDSQILLRDFTEADRSAFLAYQMDPRYLAL